MIDEKIIMLYRCCICKLENSGLKGSGISASRNRNSVSYQIVIDLYLLRGVQKLSGAVFCTDETAEKLTVLDQTNGEPVPLHFGTPGR